ncbi:MAG: rod shape-determining protein [Burkholderiaceae bacterium]
MLGFIRKYLSHDLAIDLGTSNTRVFIPGHGVTLDEPSVVTIRDGDAARGGSSVTAVGTEAWQMIGKVPDSIRAVQPVQAGVVADLTVTRDMLRQFLARAHETRRFSPSPRVLVTVPAISTQVERRAIREAVLGAGAGQVFLIEETMAAAIGAGLPVSEACGSMVLDIGGGTAEVGVISLGGMVYKQSSRIAGDQFDEAIVNYIRRNYGMLIGDQTAETIKKRIGSAFPGGAIQELEVKGRSLAEGVPRSFRISSNEVLEALAEPLSHVVSLIKQALEHTPPEIGADLSERGIMLTGGGALLANIDRLLMEESGLTVLIADDPMHCAIRGCGAALEKIDSIGSLFVQE